MIRLIGNDEVEERDTTDDNPQSSVVELHSFINVETVISRSLLLDFLDIHKHGKKNFRNDVDNFLYFTGL